MHLHSTAMLGALPPPDPTSLVRPKAIWGCPTAPWTCHAPQRSVFCVRHVHGMSSSLPRPPDAVRWRATAAAAAVQVGTEQRALVGLGTAAGQLQDSAAHVDALSEEQRAAVLAGPGHVRVIAGPGSGKTRVLAARAADLVLSRGVQPWQIMALTFTNKAGDEMKERLASVVGAELADGMIAGELGSLQGAVSLLWLARLHADPCPHC